MPARSRCRQKRPRRSLIFRTRQPQPEQRAISVVGATSATIPSSLTDTAVTLVCFTPRIIASRVVSRTGEALLFGLATAGCHRPCASYTPVEARRACPPSLGDPAGGPLRPIDRALARPTRTAKGKRARGAARSRRERSVPVRREPGGYRAATEARTASTRPCPKRARRHALRLDGARARPPVSRHAGSPCGLFADSLHFPRDRCASSHSMHPLNVSECHSFWGHYETIHSRYRVRHARFHAFGHGLRNEG